MKKPKILLIDGFSLLFRAFYALPILTNDQGEYTNAVYGFMNIFLKFYEEENPDHIAVAFDLPEPTFRHKKFSEYKGTRKPAPPEFAPQVPLLMKLLACMNIRLLTASGYEADDVLGSIATRASNLGYEVVIISGDRDLLQLASDIIKIRIPKTSKGKTQVEDYNAKDVLAKYGVSPQAFIDLKALMGDTSDNVPGVPGIGEVTATKIISTYGSLENAIANAPQIKPKKASENLQNYTDQALLSKELVTISTNVPIDFDFSILQQDIWTPEALAEGQRLGFRSGLWGAAPNPAGGLPTDPILELGFYLLNTPISTLSEDEVRIELKNNNQLYLFDEIEIPLMGVLKNMEKFGIKIDKDVLIDYGKNLDIQIDQLTAEIYELSGEVFNINSPSQLSVVLFEKLGLKGSKKTKSGYSTAADVLEKLQHTHSVIGKILSYRSHAKLKSTYVDGLLPLINDKDSRVRSTFNQTLTATGRISSSEPNLQNIPVRLPLGRELRKVFVPEDGFIFIDADYSQIELRVLAHMSGDEALINAFHLGQDIHSLTASQVFHISIDDVQPYQRHAAKAVNFGIIYGISAFGLSKDLDISITEAQMYIDGYFKKYPKVKDYMDNTIAQAKKEGYVKTLFNRRRLIPELQSSNHMTRSFGERAAMNMPIQGTAADIIKIAMVRTSARLESEKLESRLILQVHDELLLEVKKEEAEQVRILLKKEMESAASLSVPLEVDLHEGANWYEVK